MTTTRAVTRRAARAAERAELRLVPGRRGRSLRPALVPAAVVLVLAVFAVAALQAYLSQEGFRASRLETAVREAREENELLRARVAELSSPSRLQQAAAEQGMQSAPDPIFLRVPATADQTPASQESGPAHAARRPSHR